MRSFVAVRPTARLLLGALCLIVGASIASAQPRAQVNAIESGTIVCRVERSEGPPDSPVRITARLKNGSRVDLAVAPDTWFQLSNLPVGSVALRVSSRDCLGGTARVEVKPDAVDSVLIQLTCWSTNLFYRRYSVPQSEEVIRMSHQEAMRIGMPCEVHPECRLRYDIVRVQNERMVGRGFPTGSCVVIQGPVLMEVAICDCCRGPS
jgi:hypothetical protein